MDKEIKPKPTPPTPPEAWECCGSDCGEFCVYEMYAKDKQEYEEKLRQWQQENVKSS